MLPAFGSHRIVHYVQTSEHVRLLLWFYGSVSHGYKATKDLLCVQPFQRLDAEVNDKTLQKVTSVLQDVKKKKSNM